MRTLTYQNLDLQTLAPAASLQLQRPHCWVLSLLILLDITLLCSQRVPVSDMAAKAPCSTQTQGRNTSVPSDISTC